MQVRPLERFRAVSNYPIRRGLLIKRMLLETSVIRVLVVDDFEPWRRYICSTLQKDPQFEIIGEESDGLQAVRKANETQPDLILLDVALPTLNGIAALQQILQCSPKSKILLMSVERSCDVADEGLRNGAAGYVVKADAANDLSSALEAILQNRQFVSRSVNGRNASDAAHDSETNRSEVQSFPPKSVEVNPLRKFR